MTQSSSLRGAAVTLLDTNGRPLATKFVTMKCSGTIGPYAMPCRNQVTRGAKLVIPPVEMEAPDFAPLWSFLDFHACEGCVDRTIDAQQFLRGPAKRAFESVARRMRPLGFRCDFAAARVEWVLTTTPEYRHFLQQLDSAQDLERLRAMGAV